MEYRYWNILCEGPSEESFVNQVMNPYLESYGIYMTPITLGGVARYSGIRKELKRIGKDTSCGLTTMLDYYKLPQDTPGIRDCHVSQPEVIARNIEAALKEDLEPELNCKIFLPNLLMHEYEALLFSDVSCFSKCRGVTQPMIREFMKICANYATPEYINNSEQTAPSKRILTLYPEYQKVTDGTIIAKTIGIGKMMEQCPHFNEWLQNIINS